MKGFIKDEIPSRWDGNQMTHDELLAKISPTDWRDGIPQRDAALRAVVELHFPSSNGFSVSCYCNDMSGYPCPTIQAIEKELK